MTRRKRFPEQPWRAWPPSETCETRKADGSSDKPCGDAVKRTPR